MYEVFRQYVNNITSSVITDEEFSYFEQAFTVKKLKKRQFLLHEGSVCKYTAFIVKGGMRQYLINDKGAEQIIRFGLEGWWMGDRESFTNLTPSRFNIDAVEDCDLLTVTNEALNELRVKSSTYIQMTSVLDQRSYVASQNRIEATISYSAEEKLTYLMQTHPEFLQRFPQNMIASYLGLTPETLSRVRKQVLSK